MGFARGIRVAAACAAFSVAFGGQAYALTLVPGGTNNVLSISDIYTAEFALNIGDWAAAGVDVFFKVTAFGDLGSITTQTVNPPDGGIESLVISWNALSDGSGANFGNGPLAVTNALGANLFPGALTAAFLDGDVRYLIVTAASVLANETNFDLRLTAVPIPPAIALFGGALVGLGFLSRRRRSKSSLPA